MPIKLPKEFETYIPQWPLSPEREAKTFFETTQRTCSPETTWERLRGLKELGGITRVSDITYLDCVGIPTYQAVRPKVDHYQENISVYNGKGLTKIQAKVSAMMEAFERLSGELNGRPLLLKSLKEMDSFGPYVTPEELILPPNEKLLSDTPLEWVPALEIFSKKIFWVPAAAVYCPYRPVLGGHFIPNFSNTNGLASGNTLGEAIAHAFFEVVERDADTITWATGKASTIDLNTIENTLVQQLLEKFQRAGIQVTVKEITSDLGVPSFVASADEPATEDPVLLCYGMGTHFDPNIAVMRALTEVAQTRCTLISGLRGDLLEEEWKRKQDYAKMKKDLAYWFESDPLPKDFMEIPTRTHENFVLDIEGLLDRFEKCGFKQVLVTDLTLPNIGVPVVRATIPGMEQSIDVARKGKRFQNYSNRPPIRELKP